MVGGLALGSAYTLAGMRIQEGMSYGYEGAAGSSLPDATTATGFPETNLFLDAARNVRCAAGCYSSVRRLQAFSKADPPLTLFLCVVHAVVPFEHVNQSQSDWH